MGDKYHKHGVIELLINGNFIQNLVYQNKGHRQEIINKWRLLYPLRKNQKRELVIKPNAHISTVRT